MFPGKFFSARYFARRYWPKWGSFGVRVYVRTHSKPKVVFTSRPLHP